MAQGLNLLYMICLVILVCFPYDRPFFKKWQLCFVFVEILIFFAMCIVLTWVFVFVAVVVHLRATGDAPILKQCKLKVSPLVCSYYFGFLYAFQLHGY